MNAGVLHSPIEKSLILFIIAWFILIFTFKHFKKIKYKDFPRSFWASLTGYSTNNLIFGFLLLFFTYEKVTLLSARFWFLIWLGYIIWYPKYRYKKISTDAKKRNNAKKNEELKKYLP